MQWRTSSNAEGGSCVEVATDGTAVHVRDSKDRSGPVIVLGRADWRELLAVVRARPGRAFR
ncbi:DUF397 domain-containing protein [Actinomadura sp. J1-007]|uniref:DUF397 domain-containing protein n=1 Tax=Actinomadura sp. J1-007 TaxID=2661913 RepID=UPI00132BD3C0|nr:DUF397 domain-containing protein [Actinomadura sp. J1-007]MWK34854.1 DUF397 domain-containing protein [Actinomadura sp. J1-007]